MNVQQTTNKKGFTIIEVVLVLAIAALIFLMVFIALPALQRSQRDTQRKNDLSRLNTAIENYASNSRGVLPTALDSTFISGYLTAGGDTFDDPSTGAQYPIKNAVLTSSSTAGDIFYKTGVKCSGDGSTLASIPNGGRKFAIQMKLEGNGIACQNN